MSIARDFRADGTPDRAVACLDRIGAGPARIRNSVCWPIGGALIPPIPAASRFRI
jgi:hypothetical protein